MENIKDEILKSLQATLGEDLKEVEFLDDQTFKVDFASDAFNKNPLAIIESFNEAVKPFDLKEFSIVEINNRAALAHFVIKEDENAAPVEEKVEGEVDEKQEEILEADPKVEPAAEAEPEKAEEAIEDAEKVENEHDACDCGQADCPICGKKEANEDQADSIGEVVKEVLQEEGLIKEEAEDLAEKIEEKIEEVAPDAMNAENVEVSVPVTTIPAVEEVSTVECNLDALNAAAKAWFEKGEKADECGESVESVESNEEVEDSAYVKIMKEFKDAGLIKDDAEAPADLADKINAIITPVTPEAEVIPEEEQQSIQGDPVEESKEAEIAPAAAPEEPKKITEEEIAELQKKIITDGKAGILEGEKVIYMEANESIFYFDGKSTHFTDKKIEEEIDCNESCEFFNYIVSFADAIGEIVSPFLTLTPFDAAANKYSLKTAYEMDPGVISQLLAYLTPVSFKLTPVA